MREDRQRDECDEDCQYCSGECCVRHGYEPCECDVIDRHYPPREDDRKIIHVDPHCASLYGEIQT